MKRWASNSACMQGELAEIDQQLRAAQQQQAQHAAAVQKVDVAKHALACTEREAASSAGHKAQQHAEEVQAQLKEQEDQHAAALEKATAAEEKAKVCLQHLAEFCGLPGAVEHITSEVGAAYLLLMDACVVWGWCPTFVKIGACQVTSAVA